MQYKYFSKNGQLLPTSQATVSLDVIQFQYGFGVYETLKVRNGIVYFARQHAERLLKSTEIIGLEHGYSARQIQKFIHELSKKNSLESCNIKMLLIGGKTTGDSMLFILPLAPLFPDRKLYARGATVVTVHHERFLPNAKTLNMLPSYLFYTRASKNGHYDALLLDKNDSILEGTRTNFFAVKGKVLITPPKALVLEGVTRQTVIAVAKKNGYTVKEEKIPLHTLPTFDGAFLTSTSSKIVPLRQIDELQLPAIPDEVRELVKIYDNFLDNCNGVFTAL